MLGGPRAFIAKQCCSHHRGLAFFVRVREYKREACIVTATELWRLEFRVVHFEALVIA